MRFTFNGDKYRIVFWHDKSRLWADHVGHAIQLGRNPPPSGPFGTYCVTCSKWIADHPWSLPKDLRQRKTGCMIQRWDVVNVLVNGFGSGDNVEEVSRWVNVTAGQGRPNEWMGDTFNKKEGRLAALRNALDTTGGYWPELRKAAWEAYNTRGVAVKEAA